MNFFFFVGGRVVSGFSSAFVAMKLKRPLHMRKTHLHNRIHLTLSKKIVTLVSNCGTACFACHSPCARETTRVVLPVRGEDRSF